MFVRPDSALLTRTPLLSDYPCALREWSRTLTVSLRVDGRDRAARRERVGAPAGKATGYPDP